MKRAALAALAITLLTCGCADPPRPSRAEVVGTWRDKAGGVVILTADGRASVAGLPRRYFFSDQTGIVSSPGTWREGGREDQPSRLSGADWWTYRINLTHADAQGAGLDTEFNMEEDNGKPVLFFIVGDPDSDEHAEFRKTSS